MEEIVDYISYELSAPEAAHNLLDKMEENIMDLYVFPERYPLVDEEPWRTENVRKIVVENFLIALCLISSQPEPVYHLPHPDD